MHCAPFLLTMQIIFASVSYRRVVADLRFYNRVIALSAKATVDSVRRNMIAKMKINIPSTMQEQKAIANILSDMNDGIEAIEAKRDKYIAVRQGMMQQLLTGKIRLI